MTSYPVLNKKRTMRLMQRVMLLALILVLSFGVVSAQDASIPSDLTGEIALLIKVESGDGDFRNAIALLDLATMKMDQLTQGDELISTIVWSPDGEWLAYDFSRGAGWNLAIIRPDDANANIIPLDEPYNNAPQWFSDSSGLVFSSEDSMGSYSIGTVHLEDQITSSVFQLPDLFAIDTPTVAVSGRSIAFSYPESRTNSHEHDIWVLVDGEASARNITLTEDVDERDPIWSPDGMHLAHIVNDFSSHIVDPFRIVLTDVDGNPQKVILGLQDEITLCSWSPDQTMISFLVTEISDFNSLYLIETESERKYRVTPEGIDAECPAWSPNSDAMIISMTVEPLEPEEIGVVEAQFYFIEIEDGLSSFEPIPLLIPTYNASGNASWRPQ